MAIDGAAAPDNRTLGRTILYTLIDCAKIGANAKSIGNCARPNCAYSFVAKLKVQRQARRLATVAPLREDGRGEGNQR